MSTTDAALDWLLSLSATFNSSPLPGSSSPNLTDWLHISPRLHSSSSPNQVQPTSSSSPFQNLSSSSRANVSLTQELGLNYLYDFSGYFNPDGSATSGSQAGSGVSQNDHAVSTALPPMIFNQHNRMLSLESNSATLVNTPSPRPLSFFAPSGHALQANENQNKSPFSSSLFYSPATKFMQELQGAPFGASYTDLDSSSFAVQSFISDISPVVRADNLEKPSSSNDKPVTKTRKRRRRNKNLNPPSSFVEKLQAAPWPVDLPLNTTTSAPVHLEPPFESLLPFHPTPTTRQPTLLSPCKLVPVQPLLSQLQESDPGPAPPDIALESFNQRSSNVLATPPNATSEMIDELSPLTPLASSPHSPPRLKITLKLKRPLPNPETPMRRSKRPRKSVMTEFPPSPEPSERYTPEAEVAEILAPVHTIRTLPGHIQISANFPLFYRRFPASAYYQPGDVDSPCILFGVSHPGGIYNHPRSALDLYTPRFVKGKGVEKVGLCPVCLEPPERGGESKKIWLAMKFSALKCYHMQYAHGISASTGRPFSPPVAFRVIPRINPGKKEKHEIQQGKCHKCAKWVAVEGIKDMESKVKELHWWKHAAACHQESTLRDEGDYYEDDYVFKKLLSLEANVA